MIKNWQKKALKCLIVSTLDKNTMDWISVSDLYSLRALYPFSYTIYLNCLIIKARLMKYFFHSFAKKKSIRVRIIRTFVWNFKYWWAIPLQPISDKFLRFPLKIRSLEVRSHLSKPREKWHVLPRTSQNQRKDIFDLPHPLYIPGKELLQTISHPRGRRAGLVPGFARGWGEW